MFKKFDYLKLCDEIWDHNRRYFVDNAPIISDFEYDQLLKQLEAIESAHPEWIFEGSPTQRVGEQASGSFATAIHKIPMLSLANAYSFEEIEDFIARAQKGLEKTDLDFQVEPKFDGIAISIRYEAGLLVRAVTRGDGESGEVVTANVKTIASLPLKLPDDVPPVLEIRGEVFMSKKDFQLLNERYEAEGKSVFANPRNAAGGSLKLLDPQEVHKRRLSITCYHVVEGLPVMSQSAMLKKIKQWGLPVVGQSAYCTRADEVFAFIKNLGDKRESLPYEIDGAVIKLDDQRYQDRLGFTGKHVRWAIAYKYAPMQAQTVIKHITVQVGRTGVLTPVAELEPVKLAGSTISRATLHNEEEIKRKDIREGDTVLIEKGGDVIPKVVSVNLLLRSSHSQPWSMPDCCPICQTPTLRVQGEVAIRCPNKRECPAQNLRRFVHFVSKHGMDIEHCGERIVQQLVEKECVKTFADFYRLTEKDLALLEHFKEKSIHNLLESLEKSKQVPLDRFIMALGIPHVGAETALLLAQRFTSIEALNAVSYEELVSLEGIGPKMAESILRFFQDPINQEDIRQLLQLGVSPFIKKPSQDALNHPFNGKVFVLTGTLSRFTRSEASELIIARGGKISSSVGKQTDYLVCGEEAGSKLDKAKTLHIPILTEENFEALL